ncbi:MAG: hypothetical protein HRT57_16695 [Crocinitomicaceae bacterium]|nr:hypothetical protein [Crocinitomicaceae bacterium]
MAEIKLAYDPKSMVIANVLHAGDKIDYAWTIDEMYQIVIIKGSVVFGGSSYDALAIKDVQPNTNLVVTASTDASFLTLLRSDNESVVNQILPPDASVPSYYDFIKDYRPDWYDNGFPDVPPDCIEGSSGNLTLTSQDLKTMVMEGWTL